METKAVNVSYDTPLSSLKGLTDPTYTWTVGKGMITLGDFLMKGQEGFKRLRNCGEKRLKECENLIKNHAELEYDFYMRPVALTSKEVEDIQLENYSSVRLSHLNLQKEAMNFLERKDIYTIKDVLELGFHKIKTSIVHRDTKEKVERGLLEFIKKLPKEDYKYFMRIQ